MPLALLAIRMTYPDADPREDDPYRTQLERFSRPSLDLPEFERKLERDRQQHAAAFPFAYHYGRRKPRPVEESRLRELIVATESEEKRAVVRRVAQSLGFSATFIPVAETEGPIQDRMRTLTHFPIKHALSVAGGKLGYREPGCPALAMDTVAEVDGDVVLYKPNDTDEARDMIGSASGGPVVIHVGTVLHLPTRQGRLLELDTQLSIEMRLRRIPETEIKSYLSAVPDRALGTSGAIDYTYPFVQAWIDPEVPVTVTCISHLIWNGLMLMTTRALPALKTYFVGAPEEPLRGILSCVVPLAQTL